jgi:hypothetical protein
MAESSAAQLGQLVPRRIAVTAQVRRLTKDFMMVAFIGCREESEQKEHATSSKLKDIGVFLRVMAASSSLFEMNVAPKAEHTY